MKVYLVFHECNGMPEIQSVWSTKKLADTKVKELDETHGHIGPHFSIRHVVDTHQIWESEDNIAG